MNRTTKLATILVLLFSCVFLVSSFALAGYDFGDVNFNNRTVTFISFAEHFDTPEMERRMVEAEDKFNVNIETKLIDHGDTIDTMMTRFLAGDSENDIVRVSSQYFFQLVAQGALYPVDEILPQEYYDSLPSMKDAFASESLSFQFEGRRYAFSSYPGDHMTDFRFVAFNKDLFEEYGWQDPYELYEAGEWTWETMTEIARQATMDTNHDGEYDQFGITIPSWQEPVYLALSNGAHLAQEVDGRVTFTLDEEPGLNALRQLNEWYEYGAIDRDIATFSDGNAAFLMCSLWELDPQWGRPVGDMEDDFGLVPYPIGDDSEYNRFVLTGGTTNLLSLDADDPEGLVALENFFFRPEEHDEAINEYLGDLLRDRQSFVNVTNMYDQWDGTTAAFLGYLGPWGGTLHTVLWEAIEGEIGASAAMDEIKEVMQAKLDDLFQ